MYVMNRLHWTSLAIGTTATLVEGISNIDDIVHRVGTLYDPAVAAAAITSVAAACLLTFAIKAFNQKHIGIGIGLAATLVLTCGYTLSTTLWRVTEARHNSMQRIYQKDDMYRVLLDNVRASSDKVQRECRDGTGPKCETNRQAMFMAMVKLEEHQAKLDVMGQQVKWMLSPIVNISVATAGKIQSMFLPVSLMLIGMLCVGFGAKVEWIEPEFSTELTGKDAELDKAKRFIAQYQETHGSKPDVKAVAKVLKISDYRAGNLMKKVG